MKTNELGKFLKKARVARKLKLRHVGAAIGVSPAYICDLEYGRRGKNLNPIMAIRLADFLNVPSTTILQLAGIEQLPEAERVSDYLKLARNKGRASRIAESLDSARENALELVEMAANEQNPTMRRITENLMNSINDLDATLKIR